MLQQLNYPVPSHGWTGRINAPGLVIPAQAGIHEWTGTIACIIADTLLSSSFRLIYFNVSVDLRHFNSWSQIIMNPLKSIPGTIIAGVVLAIVIALIL